MSSGSSLLKGDALGLSTGEAEGKSLETTVGVVVGLGVSYRHIKVDLVERETPSIKVNAAIHTYRHFLHGGVRSNVQLPVHSIWKIMIVR
jgi:hypothetical protein